jgi:hypothetical protein
LQKYLQRIQIYRLETYPENFNKIGKEKQRKLKNIDLPRACLIEDQQVKEDLRKTYKNKDHIHMHEN